MVITFYHHPTNTKMFTNTLFMINNSQMSIQVFIWVEKLKQFFICLVKYWTANMNFYFIYAYINKYVCSGRFSCRLQKDFNFFETGHTGTCELSDMGGGIWIPVLLYRNNIDFWDIPPKPIYNFKLVYDKNWRKIPCISEQNFV